MTLYWSLKSYPELAPLQPNECRAVSRACWWHSFRHWQTWVAFLSQFVFIYGGVGLGMMLDGFPQSTQFPTLTLVFFCLGSSVALAIFTQVYSRMVRPHFRRYVDEHFRNNAA
jgi:hypothetical protein